MQVSNFHSIFLFWYDFYVLHRIGKIENKNLNFSMTHILLNRSVLELELDEKNILIPREKIVIASSAEIASHFLFEEYKTK